MLSIFQVWFVDEAFSGGRLETLRSWWERLSLIEIGRGFGYFPKLVMHPKLV